MRRLAFIVIVVGMLVLVLLLSISPRSVLNYDEMSDTEINEKVMVVGKVISERVVYGGTKVMILDNGVELICECSESYKDKEIEVVGIIEEYKEKKQIRVLELVVR